MPSVRRPIKRKKSGLSLRASVHFCVFWPDMRNAVTEVRFSSLRTLPTRDLLVTATGLRSVRGRRESFEGGRRTILFSEVPTGEDEGIVPASTERGLAKTLVSSDALQAAIYPTRISPRLLLCQSERPALTLLEHSEHAFDALCDTLTLGNDAMSDMLALRRGCCGAIRLDR